MLFWTEGVMLMEDRDRRTTNLLSSLKKTEFQTEKFRKKFWEKQ